MKIVIITFHFPPKWLSGTEIAAYNIAEQVALLGHQVNVICSKDRGIAQDNVCGGFNENRISLPNIRILKTIYFWLSAIIILLKLRPEIVQAHSIGMGMPGLLLKAIYRTPYIVWGQGSDIYRTPLTMKLISRYILLYSEVAIGLTEHMKEQLQRYTKNQVVVVPNGANIQDFKLVNKKQSRAILEIHESEKIIVYVGRFRSIKGLEYLIEAMKIILKRLKARLLLVGEGPDEYKLRCLIDRLNIKESVNFIGKVPNNEIPKYLIAGDVFVLPSLSEGFPLVVIEAMAAGLPIVASDIGGLSEIIKNGENGFLIPPKNPKELADKIMAILSNDTLQTSISKINRETANQYSWSEIARKLNAVYTALEVYVK